MNIGMVLNGNYPQDIRVRKEAETLAAQHNVFVLCKKNSQEKSFEIINGVTVIRKISYKSLAHEGIIDVISSVNFIHPFFKRELPHFITTYQIKALHIHDLPLAKTAYSIGKKMKVKLILDLHENYPAALKTWFSWRKSFIIRAKNKLFFSYERWRKYEADIIKKYDIIIAVVEEMKARLIAQHSINPEKIVVVPNSEKIVFAKNFEENAEQYFKDLAHKFIISYVGGFGPHRGLHTAILGMKEVVAKIPNAYLVLIGPSNKDVNAYLVKLIQENNLQNAVLIKGSEPFKNVVSIMKGAHLNTIPHISNEHTESAVPHKFYQILLSGKPLLVSNCAPMKRMVIAENIGNFFEAENPKSFADAVIKIHANYSIAEEKAKRGQEKALFGHLNWEHTSKSLVALYDNL